jgi:hypothetical protein
MRKPSCSQCRRAARNCWGYIDPQAIMFRNENSKFEDLRRIAPFGTPLNQDQWSPMPYIISPTLPISCEDQAKCFFFQNFVLEDTCSSRGHFDYLTGIYRNLKIYTFLEDAVVALGLAGLANRMKVSKVMLKANIRYSAAVRAVSSALGEMECARSNQILIAVMLLSLYEVCDKISLSSLPGTYDLQTIASQTPQSLRLWTQHTKGATSLLRLRGEEQLHTGVGRRLFVQLRSQVVSHTYPIHLNWFR